jgi:hypothetical protein
MKNILITFCIIFFPFTLLPQNCDNSEFDFWIGKWKVEWIDENREKKEGTNFVKNILGKCVIEENFNGNPGLPFEGKSFSVFNSRKNIWQQTWVDNSGGYMVFEGKWNNGKMILSRNIEKDGKMIAQRMVFYNIKDDSLDWNWETSIDEGKTWKLNWKLHYTRLEK